MNTQERGPKERIKILRLRFCISLTENEAGKKDKK